MESPKRIWKTNLCRKPWKKGGQGILHFAAILGYRWVSEPTIVAGVSVQVDCSLAKK